MRRGGHRSGQAFIVAMLILAIISSITAVAIVRTTGSARLNARASDFAEGERVADAAVEYAYGVWKKAIQANDGPLTSADLTALNPTFPTIPNYAELTNTVAEPDSQLKIAPADQYGAITNTPAKYFQYLDDFPGWRGFVYNYSATVKIKATTGLSKNKYITGTKRMFQYIEVPLFQSMFFFEDDLEIYRPAPMIVGGLVHSNHRLLVSGSADVSGSEITFQGHVSYADADPKNDPNNAGSKLPGYTFKEPPVGAPTWSGISAAAAPGKMEEATFSSGGVSAQLAKSQGRYEPLGTKPASVIDPTDSNPNNDSYHELIESAVTSGPGSGPDPGPIAKRRLNGKAGIIVTVAGTAAAPTVTVTPQNGTTLTPQQETDLKAAFTGRSTIYDARETKNVDVANFDVSKLTPVLNAASGFNGVVYLQDTTPKVTSGSGADTEPRTVRLTKGGVLPDGGLTIASPNPVYIQGDYNTGTTTNPNAVPANSTGNVNNTDSPVVPGYTRKPSAVVADAVMFLSNNWSDANASKTLTNRAATNTTYNTAILAGFTPSGWQPPSGSAYGYSGGANNFPRFLETWSDDTCTYYGSMVELYKSEIFTGRWDTGSIYSAPKRRWNYDTLFNNTPPPGNVDAVVISRGSWARLGPNN